MKPGKKMEVNKMRRSGGSGRGEKLIVCWPGRQRRGSCYHPAMFSNLQKHTTLHFFLLNTEEISIHPCTHPTTATIQHFPLRISTKQSKAAGPLVSCSSMINPSCFQGYFSSQHPPPPLFHTLTSKAINRAMKHNNENSS